MGATFLLSSDFARGLRTSQFLLRTPAVLAVRMLFSFMIHELESLRQNNYNLGR